MIRVHEHYEYGKTKGLLNHLKKSQATLLTCDSNKVYSKTITRLGEKAECYHISYKQEEKKHHCKTTYFVGIDWIIENKLSVYVQPKQNDKETEIDYLRMLFDALEETQNLEHLDGLYHIDINRPLIKINQKQDLLSPFLIIQYLQILRGIVRKGLKKTYYPVTQNLEARVKGKVMMSQTLKKNITRNQLTKTVCQYEEFGYNGEENRILKKAFLFSRKAIKKFKIGNEKHTVDHIIDYIQPAFQQVSDEIPTDKIKRFKPDPLYKEYNQALKLALLILQRYSYNINQTNQQEYFTYPFWIDMSKLFELYVFKKLCDIFPGYKEVQYHLKNQKQELDFLINSKEEKKEFIMVVDAKYRPRYHKEQIITQHVRQVCGYARMKKIYDELNLKDYNRNIDCLIIYAHQECKRYFEKKDIKKYPQKNYVNLYKLGIALPQVKRKKVNADPY